MRGADNTLVQCVYNEETYARNEMDARRMHVSDLVGPMMTRLRARLPIPTYDLQAEPGMHLMPRIRSATELARYS